MVGKISDAFKAADPKDVALKMKLDYTRGVKDQITRQLEAIFGLCVKLEKPDLNLDAFFAEVADVAMRVFGIETVAICVRDPVDKLYRYRTVAGFEKENADAFKRLAYTREDLVDNKKYPHHDISNRTYLFLAEEHPFVEGEETTYRRPGLMGMRRRTINDSLEEDYIDLFFYGSDGDILGFIETSGTRLRKLPDPTTIRWLELLACITGLAFQRRH